MESSEVTTKWFDLKRKLVIKIFGFKFNKSYYLLIRHRFPSACDDIDLPMVVNTYLLPFKENLCLDRAILECAVTVQCSGFVPAGVFFRNCRNLWLLFKLN